MFAPGTKIVKDNYSYIVVDDNLLNRPDVPVWYSGREGTGFVTMAREDIFADIVDGAYVTSVRHNVTSETELNNAISEAVDELLPLWRIIASRPQDDFVFHIMVLEVLSKVAAALCVNCDKFDITLKINGGTYKVERKIIAALLASLA